MPLDLWGLCRSGCASGGFPGPFLVLFCIKAFARFTEVQAAAVAERKPICQVEAEQLSEGGAGMFCAGKVWV